MTIIRPQQHKIIATFLILLAVIVGIGGIAAIVAYNNIAGARQAMRELEGAIQAAKSEQSDLKDAFFHATDLADLERSAAEQGLVLEAAPQYLALGRNAEKNRTESNVASR